MTKVADGDGSAERGGKGDVGGRVEMVTPVQERAFVNWCNIILRKKGFQIKDVSDLDDGVCLLIILKHVSGKSIGAGGGSGGGAMESPLERNWRIILKLLEQEDIQIAESPDTIRDVTRKTQVINFIVWRIILRFQICDDEMLKITPDRQLDYARAPIRLLRWVQHMIPDSSVTNFTTDWNNGLALCHLLNAIIPGTIKDDMILHKDNNEINVRLACNSAEDELGIPELLAPYDIANNMTDEKCMMIYLALFRSAHNATNKPQYTDDSMLIEEKDVIYTRQPPVVGIQPQTSKVIAFGAGLRWGQVGKPSEFFVQVGGPEFADLSISIECRPFDRRATQYKPCLQIKSIDKTSYLVRYTPTRPGEYILNVFCAGVHIPNSPFRIQVHESVLKDHYIDDEILISFNPAKVTYTESHLLDSIDSTGTDKGKDFELSVGDSAFGDDDYLSSFADSKSWEAPSTTTESLAETNPGNTKIVANDNKTTEAMKHGDNNKIRIYGTGLKSGEVGLVSSFSVRTSNTEKGPLSVSITCPALSIPVPNVKTHLHGDHMMHEVFYLPTEPGIYQVDVNWGMKPIEGSPFYLTVIETRSVDSNTLHCSSKDDGASDIKEARISYYRSKDKNNLIIYHSATTGDTKERVNKNHLEWLLRQENPLDALICITIDLEMERLGRKKIFDKACSKKLPMVFVNDHYVGSFDEIVDMHHQGTLKDVLLKYKDVS